MRGCVYFPTASDGRVPASAGIDTQETRDRQEHERTAGDKTELDLVGGSKAKRMERIK